MGDCCMGEEDNGDGRDVLLEVPQLFDIEGFVPADVDEDLHAAIKFKKRLRRAARGLCAC